VRAGDGCDSFVVLVADDDEDDCLLAETAFQVAGCMDSVRFVNDGRELMEYLHRKGRYSDPGEFPRPDLIVLDLNMPRKDGLEALSEIKAHPRLKNIPVVILTTSREERDAALCRKAGAFAFISKPNTFEEWVEIARSIIRTTHKSLE